MKKITIDASFLTAVILNLYLVFLGIVLPLYFPNGYYMLGYEKFLLWRPVSLAGLFLIALIQIISFIKQNLQDLRHALLTTFQKMITSFSFQDAAVPAYVLCLLVSFLFSMNHEESLWGAEGWNMGFLTWLVILAYSFLYRKVFQWKKAHYAVLCFGAGIVFLLGILQRFGIFTPDELSGNPEFLTTIGNINWYAGYQSIMVPLFIALACTQKQTTVHALITFFVLFFSALSLFTNGSNVIWPVTAVLILMWAVLSLSNRSFRYHLPAGLCGIFAVLSFLRIVHVINEDLFVSAIGEGDSLASVFSETPLCHLFTAAALCAALITVLRHNKNETSASRNTVSSFLLKLAVYGLIAGSVLLLVLQLFEAVPVSDSFGSNRGFFWRVSARMFRYLPLYRKLIGVGPDCFGWYNLALPEIRLMMYEQGVEVLLSNAHSELLNMTVTLGLFGTACFLWILISRLRRAILLFEGNDDERVLKGAAVILMAAGLLTDCLVSFQDILTLPYFMILLELVNISLPAHSFRTPDCITM